MKHWDWETNLKLGDEGNWYDGDTPEKLEPQAEKAVKIRELYLWWKDVRPNRPDPWKDWEPGKIVLDENNIIVSDLRGNWTREQFDAAQKIEDDFEIEDTVKTQELIAIRHSLWT